MISNGGLIGARAPRATAKKLVAGRGCYTDDIILPGMLHVAFARSAFSHGRLLSIDVSEAMAMPGVKRIVTGAELAEVCLPFHTNFSGVDYRNTPQPLLAIDEVCWQGMPVAAVVAESRAAAEDAADLVFADIEELPAVADLDDALEGDAPPRVSSEPSNLAFETVIAKGDVDQALSAAHAVVEHDFDMGRQTGVPLEARSIIADYRPGADTLSVVQSHQAPYQQRELIALHLGIDSVRVNVRCPDVGGAFGIKLHMYPDELAVCAISKMLGRPIKYIADRMESFLSDAHAREARVHGRIGVDAEGKIIALDVDLRLGLGAYSSYPRGSIGEGMQAIQVCGAPYAVPNVRARLRCAYQNKPPSGAYRGVGQPIGVVFTEQLVDLAARAIAMDPAELRRRNHQVNEGQPHATATGLLIGDLSLDACLEKLLATMDYDRLREEQRALRAEGRYRGIGLANFVEMTAVGSGLYGSFKVPLGSGEGCALRLEASGHVNCETTATEQGQGTGSGIGQIVAETIGVALDHVVVTTSSTSGATFGGGAWASRGIAIGGEAALLAARDLKRNILIIAASMLQVSPDDLDIRDGHVVDRSGPRVSLSEIGTIGHFRQFQLPLDVVPELSVTRQYVPRSYPYLCANGVQAAHVEIDPGTGLIKILGFWVVEDCGRVINPLLVDEQIRGGVVQGIGAALYEHCRYDGEGQLLNGSMADYAVPMAAEMPDIVIGHVETPAPETELGAKGAGEAGTVGSIGAIWTAVNDALSALGASVTHQPFTPDHVLGAILAARGQTPGD